MRTRIQKWGNSLALRILKSFASEVHLEQDAEVEISVVDGNLIVSPLQPPSFTLDELLADITEDNLHGEFDWGRPVGKEV